MSLKKNKFSKKDKFFMEIALNLAKSREGLTGTNPSVGCVIVKNDNSKVEDEVRNEVISLTSSFPIYKNL